MSGQRGQSMLRDIVIGLILAIPYLGLIAFSLWALNASGVGDLWYISRKGIRLYCLAMIGAGLAMASFSVPKVVGLRPESIRLRGWAMFVLGVGCALLGAMMQWYMLAKRDYQHPSVEPFKTILLLLVVWVILVGFSIYSVRLERKAGGKQEGGP